MASGMNTEMPEPGTAESNARQIAEYYNQYGSGAYGQQYQQGGDYYSQGGYSGYPSPYSAGSYPAMTGYPAASGFTSENITSPLDAEIQVVLSEMRGELELLKNAGEYGEQFKNAKRLLSREIDSLENTIDPEWLEVDIPKPIKVSKKILIPSFRHPHFNFVGKVLGPRGQTLQSLAKQFKCHVYVLGRGSTKDRNKEEELLSSGDSQYAHYGGPLHVKVETIAPAHIAYARVAGVLESLCNTLVPVRDELVEKQMAKLNEGGKEGEENGKMQADGAGRGRGKSQFRGAALRPSFGPIRGPMRGRGVPVMSPRPGLQTPGTFYKHGTRLGAPY